MTKFDHRTLEDKTIAVSLMRGKVDDYKHIKVVTAWDETLECSNLDDNNSKVYIKIQDISSIHVWN